MKWLWFGAEDFERVTGWRRRFVFAKPHAVVPVAPLAGSGNTAKLRAEAKRYIRMEKRRRFNSVEANHEGQR